jgi:hypothetical protein
MKPPSEVPSIPRASRAQGHSRPSSKPLLDCAANTLSKWGVGNYELKSSNRNLQSHRRLLNFATAGLFLRQSPILETSAHLKRGFDDLCRFQAWQLQRLPIIDKAFRGSEPVCCHQIQRRTVPPTSTGRRGSAARSLFHRPMPRLRKLHALVIWRPLGCSADGWLSLRNVLPEFG